MKIYTGGAVCELPQIIADLCVGDPLKKRIIFCEDKFTLAIELAIAKRCGGSFGTRVFSFNRFMHKYLSEDRSILSPEGCALVVKRLLLEQKDKLLCFKNVYDPNLANIVYELIAQLKSAKVTPQDIQKAAEFTSGNLKHKLQDIYIVFSEYERFIEQNCLTDGNNRLSALPTFFDLDDDIRSEEVIIAGFPSLNKTLCRIFQSLWRNAKNVDFVLAAGKNDKVYANETFNFAVTQFNPEIVEITSPLERQKLLNGLFNPDFKREDFTKSNKVSVYRARNTIEEVEYAARLICKNVRDGAKYKHFAVCAEDIAPYELTIKRVFSDYSIPAFFDTKRDLSKHPLTEFVCLIIDAARYNYEPSKIIELVKSPLFTDDKALSDNFENYCLKYALNRKTMRSPFVFKEDNYDEYENIRARAVAAIDLFKGCKLFKDYVCVITQILHDFNIEQQLKTLGDRLNDGKNAELAAYNEQAEEKFLQVLNNAAEILGDKKMPIAEVKNVILSGMAACKISLIPMYDDCVFVGDFRAVKYNEYKNIFALGMNDGVPSVKMDSALLCDRDIVKMESVHVLVEPKIKEVNRRGRETVCMALASFTDHLYLSWATSDTEGSKRDYSEIIKYIIKIFLAKDESGNINNYIADSKSNNDFAIKDGTVRGKTYLALPYMTERSSAFAFAREFSAYKEGEREDFTVPGSYFAVMQENGKADVCRNILHSANNEVGYYTEGVNYAEKGLSATAIEGYFFCPYSNFLSRGVKLKEREESNIKANTIGNMIHEVAERFTKKADFYGTEEKARKLAETLFEEITAQDEYSRYTKSASGVKIFEYIRRETVRFCLTLYNGCFHSAFKPQYLEVSFGSGLKAPITVQTRYGSKNVIGKADRIDVCDDKMCIVDYKTGAVRGSDEENLFMGKKLQLFLYAKAFSDKYQTAGVYYFPVADEFGKEDEPFVMSMKGKTLADFNTACLIDDTITPENAKGMYISANLTAKKDGGFKYPNGLLTADEFTAYLDYAEKIAAEGISEINDGVIVPSPCDNACSYCKYKGMCGYDKTSDARKRSTYSRITKGSIIYAAMGKKQLQNEDDNDDMDPLFDCSGDDGGDW